MPALAAAVGVGVGSVYRCFPSKQDLIAALVVAALDEVTARSRDALAGAGEDAFGVAVRAALGARRAAGGRRSDGRADELVADEPAVRRAADRGHRGVRRAARPAPARRGACAPTRARATSICCSPRRAPRARSTPTAGGACSSFRSTRSAERRYQLVSSAMDETSLMTAADHAALAAELARARGGGPPRDRAADQDGPRVGRSQGEQRVPRRQERPGAPRDEDRGAARAPRARRGRRGEHVPVGVVGLGSGVHVRDEDGREQRFEIVSSNTAAPARGQDLGRVAGRARAARHAGRRRGDRHAPAREPPLHGVRSSDAPPPDAVGAPRGLRPTPYACARARALRQAGAVVLRRAAARAAGSGRCSPGAPRCLRASGSGSARSRASRRRGDPRGR